MGISIWAGRTIAAILLLLVSACTTTSTPTSIATGPTLADREAIEATLYRYTRGLDRHDPDLYTSAWAEDCEFDLGTTVLKGRPAMRGIITGLIDNNAAAVKRGETPREIFHMDANSRIEFLAADHAIHHAYYFTFRRTGKGLQSTNTVIAIGSTTDELRKINGEWLIVKRTVMDNP